MAMPRFLPIVFVAVAGVLAMKAITSLDIVPDAFHAAQAFAADAQKPKAKTAGKAGDAKAGAKKGDAAKSTGADETNKGDDPTESYAVDPTLLAAAAGASASDAAATAPVAPICATSVDELAREANMSPSEIQILQNLGTRRAQLDQREAQLNSRGQLVDAADAKLDGRIQQLTDLKAQIQALLDQAAKGQDADTQRLVAVYAAMKPKDAAAAMTIMSDDVRLPIAAQMKDRGLAAIMGAMTPDAARDLTEKLAKRMQQANGLQQQLNKVAAGGTAAANPPAATPALASAKPAAASAASAPKKGK